MHDPNNDGDPEQCLHDILEYLTRLYINSRQNQCVVSWPYGGVTRKRTEDASSRIGPVKAAITMGNDHIWRSECNRPNS